MSNNPNMLATIKNAMETPEIKNSNPGDLVSNLMSALNISDLTPVTDEEAKKVLETYFQAIVLDKDDWIEMPELGRPLTYIQIFDFKLQTIPDGTSLVADVLVDKSDFELECFNRYVSGMNIRGKSVFFYSIGVIPVTITLGLKCIDAMGEVVIPTESDYRTKKKK